MAINKRRKEFTKLNKEHDFQTTKFACWKKIKIKTQHEKINYCKNINVTINKRRKEFTKLNKEHDFQTTVIYNFKTIDKCDNWSQLLILETFLSWNFNQR